MSDKWSQFMTDQSFGRPALVDPTAMNRGMTGLRIRRELPSRDAINSRAWDSFHATPPTQVSSDNLQTPVYMDMNSKSSRFDTVQYRVQPDYMPEPSRGTTRAGDLGVPPVAGQARAPPTKFSTNPYTQRLDAGGFDSRNIIREMRGAVVEDNRERQIDADRMLTERQFYDRWLPARAATDAASLQAYELLRPKQDEWKLEK